MLARALSKMRFDPTRFPAISKEIHEQKLFLINFLSVLRSAMSVRLCRGQVAISRHDYPGGCGTDLRKTPLGTPIFKRWQNRKAIKYCPSQLSGRSLTSSKLSTLQSRSPYTGGPQVIGSISWKVKASPQALNIF